MVIDITKQELYPLWSPATEKERQNHEATGRMEPKSNHKQKRRVRCSPNFVRLATPEKGKP